MLIAEILWIAIVYRTSWKVLPSVKPELVKPDIFVQKAPFLIARSVKTIFDDVSLLVEKKTLHKQNFACIAFGVCKSASFPHVAFF